MDITYKLGGEQLYAKVGEHCELQYPNELFLQLLKVVIFTVTVFLTIILLVQSNVHFALFVLCVRLSFALLSLIFSVIFRFTFALLSLHFCFSFDFALS